MKPEDLVGQVVGLMLAEETAEAAQQFWHG